MSRGRAILNGSWSSSAQWGKSDERYAPAHEGFRSLLAFAPAPYGVSRKPTSEIIHLEAFPAGKGNVRGDEAISIVD